MMFVPEAGIYGHLVLVPEAGIFYAFTPRSAIFHLTFFLGYRALVTLFSSLSFLNYVLWLLSTLSLIGAERHSRSCPSIGDSAPQLRSDSISAMYMMHLQDS